MTGIQAPLASPLSVAQEGVWYLSLLAPQRLSYNEAISIHKEGPLDQAALSLALREILRRHAAWRTTFDTADGEPVQIVHPVPDVAIPILDLTKLSREEAERQAARITGRAAAVPYDLRRGPLVRPWLAHFPGDHHRLVLAMHHIVFDGVSLARVILPDLVMLYDAFVRGEPPALAEPTASYADYARWEREWSCGERFEQRLAWWRAHLTDVQPLSLPVDRTPPTPRSFRAGIVPLRLEADELARLAAVAAEAGATVFQALATVWAILLARVCGAQEIVSSTSTGMRQRREFERIVGFSLTPLVLRVEVDRAVSFCDLLVRMRNEVLDGLDHLVPFERIVRDLGEGRVEDANPIYGTMITLEPAYLTPDPAWSLHLLGSGDKGVVGGAKLDLELQLDERPDGELQGRLVFDRDLFSAATAKHLATLWVRLARAAAAAPAQPVSTLPLMTAAEARRQLVEWNATAAGPAGASIERLLSQASARRAGTGARLTLGEHTIAVDELERLAEAAARRLRDGGLAPASIVDVLAVPAIETVAEAWGALRAGCAYRLVDPDALPAAGAVGADICCVAPGVSHDTHPLEVPIRSVSAANLARVLVSELGVASQDTVLLLSEELSVRSLLLVWAALAAGASVVLAAGGEDSDGASVHQLLRRHQVTVLATAPGRWESLLATGLRGRRGLVAISVGGRLTPELAGRILARAQILWSTFGPAETAFSATLSYVRRAQPFTIGRPVANMRAYVLDPAGEPVPARVVGDLLIAGDGVAAGYLGLPEATSAAFVQAPDGSEPAFRTGERARWVADGELELV